MQIPFRQGIVRVPTALTGPQGWLQKTSQTESSIDINVGSESTVISLAHYSANYLFEETRTIVGAWGGGERGSTNGPLTALGQTQWLYWDVDLGTGSLTRGWTSVAPQVAASEPVNPALDTHWFDTVNTRMRVFTRSSAGANGNWIDKIRLFAAVYDQNAKIIPYPLGSQVSLAGKMYGSGNLIMGVNNKPLKQSDGTFATTESDLIIYQTSGQNVKFDMALVYAQAAEELPQFYLVSFLPNRTIGLASSNNIGRFVSGMVIANHHTQEMAQVITNGMVRNEQWSWPDSSVNAPLFCGTTGEITLTPPVVGVNQVIGFIVDSTSIYVQLQAPIRLR